jgi:hypothetical protein
MDVQFSAEPLNNFLSQPIIQVAFGGILSALVSFVTTHLTLRQQYTSIKVEQLDRRAIRVENLLDKLDPVNFSVGENGEIAQNITPVENYEKVRTVHFKNQFLLQPDSRKIVNVAYRRAELAYLLLNAPGDNNAEFRQLAIEQARHLGIPGEALRDQGRNELIAVLTTFCMMYRDVLIDEHDRLNDAIYGSFQV